MLSIDVGAGGLTERWELQRKLPKSRTAAGGVSFTWVTERKVWCKIIGGSSGIPFEAGAREPQITHTVIARLEGGDIGPTKRFLKGTRVLMIAGTVEIVDEADDLIRFGVTEGVAT